MEDTQKRHRSVSQLKSYNECPKRFELERIEKVWQRPAAWSPQGTAVHAAVEGFERSKRTMTLEEAQDIFRDTYRREIIELLTETPNTDYWFASGPYRGTEYTGKNGKHFPSDIERRFDIGLMQVERYLNYRHGDGASDVIYVAPDGTPGIELEFNIDLDGIILRGFIDLLTMYVAPESLGPDGKIKVVDVKTGNKPGDETQLGAYGVAVEDKFGEQVDEGTYLMTGKPREKLREIAFDLKDFTREGLTEQIHELDENANAGRFPAKPDPDKCGFCPVATSCDEAVFF